MVSVLIIVCCAIAENANDLASLTASDNICGPRCVQWILQSYGKSADLTTLVQETQAETFREGASLAALAESLERRGVYTSSVHSEAANALLWDHPLLVHMVADEASLGHFVVLQPSNSAFGSGTVWDGLREFRKWSREDTRRHSGNVLLTSAEPIDVSKVRHRDGASVSFAKSIVVLAAGAAGLLAIRRRHRLYVICSTGELV